MPTLPPRFDSAPSHTARGIAESFGSDAAAYHRARPGYPRELVDRVVAASPGRDVLDVGIGTGISAEGFRAAGCQVLGVDPDARMADFARGLGYEVEVAPIEQWDPAGRQFDVVVAGQTWHWVEPLEGARAARRALRARGRIALFWNTFQVDDQLAASLSEVYSRVLPGTPFARGMFAGPEAYAGVLDRVAGGIEQAGGFGPIERWATTWRRTYSRDEWLQVVPTAGGLNQLPQAQLAQLLDGVGAAIDAVGGGFEMTYTTLTVTATHCSD